MNSSFRRSRRKSEINIVPLVDVLIVLIFFFLVSMQFKNMNTLNLKLPKIETAGTNRFSEQIEIAVTVEGQLFYNGIEMTKADLEKAIQLAGENSPEIPVLLMADEESAIKWITFVMDLCRKSGMEKLKLQSR